MSSGDIYKGKIEPIRGYHNVTSLVYHLVLVSKYRKATLDDSKVKRAITTVALQNEVKIIEMNIGELNHVHLLLQVSPKKPMSTVVAIIKAKASGLLKEMPEWGGWSKGFYLSTVGTNDLTVVQNYIKNQ